MAAIYDHITEQQRALIEASHIFFIASVDPAMTRGPAGEGPLNLSPKGATPLHVIDANRVVYLDYPGSGNETARHALAGGPVTLMVMSMTAEDAAIVRLYGKAEISEVEDSAHAAQLTAQPAEHLHKPRQAVSVLVERTQTSCGYGVPVFRYEGERAKQGRGRRFKEPKS